MTSSDLKCRRSATMMGGERREFEIADFPRLNKRLIRDRQKAYIVHRSDLDVFDHGDVKE